MPILNVQISLREVGRIRAGDQVTTGKKRAPRRLEKFRFTADDPQLLGIVADLYGGQVQPWPDAPSGELWQVYTTADSIRVMIVPGLRPITQWWEAWSGGGCLRRCDGQREQISGTGCVCEAQGDRICKPTTRLHVVLPDIPGLGTWRLDSTGYYAAVELGGITALISKLVQATGDPVYGTLRLTQRTQKVQGQPTRHFTVPALDVSVTVPELVQRMQLAEGQQAGIDAANSSRVRALAEGHQPAPGGFLSAAEQEQAEQRAARKQERKRAPEMGPGRRARAVPPDLPIDMENLAEDTPPLDEYEVKEAFASPLSDKQRKALHTLFRVTGLDDRDERLMFSAKIIGRSINSSNDLTSFEAGRIIDVLQAVEAGQAQYVTDVDGRILGAAPVLADTIHEDSYTFDPDQQED